MSWYKAMLVKAGRFLPSHAIRGLDVVVTRLRPGRFLSSRAKHNVNAVVNYLEAGRWLRHEGYRVERWVRDRNGINELVARRIGDQRVLLVELGVYQGRSIAYWSERLSHPEAAIHGFDSFQGLPEDWNFHFAEEFFSLGGKAPRFDDPRVKLFVGWFHETLPGYRPPPHEVLFVNLDADLYSSTKTALDHLKEHLVPGTYLYLDEFCDRNHEKRAFAEYLAETGHRYRLLAADPTLSNVLFQRVP